MNLNLNINLAKNYSSKSQIARVLSENWVHQNLYCPCCGQSSLNEFENNKPVADFFCKRCSEEYELKSKKGNLTNTISDGAYSTMIERINSNNNPNFFFLTYNKSLQVENFLLVPKQFFIPEIIIKRKPLAPTAKRAGWVGCNIDVSKISNSGRVFIVKNSQIIDKRKVSDSFKQTLFIREKSAESKGWILDILKCVDSIHKKEFSLDEMYKFETELKIKYPNNNFIKDKIRQQLQILRDKGILEFLGRGKYKRIE